jgi:hypothetical protein
LVVNPALRITGTITPDVTGDYYLNGLHLGSPCYRKLDNSAFVFSFDLGFSWVIADSMTDMTFSWQRVDSNVAGDYDPLAGASGIANVVLF